MTTARRQSWSHIDLGETAENDSLLACLVLLTRYYQNPFSPRSLVARLPLVENKLDIELFPRAAARAALNAELIHLKLKEISDDQLPVVLIKKR